MMSAGFLEGLFSLEGQVAVVTGGTGVLGGTVASGLAQAGAKVAIIGRNAEKLAAKVGAIIAEGGDALCVQADVLDAAQLEAARTEVLNHWGKVDILINAAGGNIPAATTPNGAAFFSLPREAFGQVMDLNLLGTLLPSQIFGQAMVAHADDGQKVRGSIVNFSSMAAQRTLTRVLGYAAAKSAVENLTRFLAVELARQYGDGIRVNAVAPGFFIGEQNRAMLLSPDGALTERGKTIIGHTPAGRFGEAAELVGTLIWLCSPGASFVNGVVVPVDGGFSAFSGV